MDLSVLGEVRKNATVRHSRFDIRLERSFAQRLPHGDFKLLEPFTARRADRNRAGMLRNQDIDE